METRISLTITRPDDTIYGEASLSVSRWDGARLEFNSIPYKDVAIFAHLEPNDNVYPYAIAAMRDAADRAIADMMMHFSRGEVLLMRETIYDKKT